VVGVESSGGVVVVVVVAVATVVVVVVVVVAVGTVVVVVVVEESAGGWACAAGDNVMASVTARPPASAEPSPRAKVRRGPRETRGRRDAGGDMIDHWCIGTDPTRVEDESMESSRGATATVGDDERVGLRTFESHRARRR